MTIRKLAKGTGRMNILFSRKKYEISSGPQDNFTGIEKNWFSTSAKVSQWKSL